MGADYCGITPYPTADCFLTEQARLDARCGALRGVPHVVVDDHHGVDGVAQVGLRPLLSLLGEVVSEVKLAEDTAVVSIHPRSRVLLDDVLARRDDVQVQAVGMLAEDLGSAFDDGDAVTILTLQEMVGLKELPHFRVRLFWENMTLHVPW